MPAPLTLVIDQGTYSTRALAFDPLGQVQAAAQLPVKLRGHGSDKVEQNAAEILDSMQQVVANVLAEPKVRRTAAKMAQTRPGAHLPVRPRFWLAGTIPPVPAANWVAVVNSFDSSFFWEYTPLKICKSGESP